MNNMYKVFGCYTDLQLNNIFNKLDMTVTEMINMDDIVENNLLSVDEKRAKLLEMFSYSPCVDNYPVCEEVFKTAKEKEDKNKQLKESKKQIKEIARKPRQLKEDVLPNNVETTQLNMNQTIELNSLFELASEKFKKVNCSQQFYDLLSQKTSKNIANAFFNMLKSIPEDSECRFDPQLVIDGRNFAETISPFVNELKTFLNNCKAETKKEEVKEDYNADKLSKIDHQIDQLENNLKKFEQEKNSYLDEYSKLEYKLDKVRLKKLKAKREEYLNESIETQPDMFGGPDTYYKDGIEALDFDNVIDAMKEIAPKLDFTGETHNNGKYSMIFYPKSSINMKEVKKIKESMQEKFGKENISVKLAHSQYAPEIKKVYVTFIDKVDVQDELEDEQLDESLLSSKLESLKYHIAVSNDTKTLKYLKNKLSKIFNENEDTEDRNKLSELISMINSKLNKIKPIVDECCGIDSLLEPFKPTVINITINDDGCLEDNEKELCANSMKALASHINDEKDCCEENNIENMQTINSLLGTIANYFHTKLCESQVIEKNPYKGDTLADHTKASMWRPGEEELDEDSNNNIIYDPNKELEDIKERYLNKELDYYDAIKEVENITGNEKIAEEKVESWDNSSEHGLYGITDNSKMEDAIETVNAQIDDFGSYDDEYVRSICEDVAKSNGIDVKKLYYYVTNHKWSVWDEDEYYDDLDEDTVYDHSWYEVKGQKYPKRTKNGVEIKESKENYIEKIHNDFLKGKINGTEAIEQLDDCPQLKSEQISNIVDKWIDERDENELNDIWDNDEFDENTVNDVLNDILIDLDKYLDDNNSINTETVCDVIEKNMRKNNIPDESFDDLFAEVNGKLVSHDIRMIDESIKDWFKKDNRKYRIEYGRNGGWISKDKKHIVGDLTDTLIVTGLKKAERLAKYFDNGSEPRMFHPDEIKQTDKGWNFKYTQEFLDILEKVKNGEMSEEEAKNYFEKIGLPVSQYWIYLKLALPNKKKVNEMCSGGACCAGAVANVPSPAKPKTPKRKHKKSKVDEMALNMFKRQIIEDVNSQFDANGNHYEFKNGYLYINGNIARTKSKFKMFEALDEMLELETLPGFNSSEMLMLEDIEANGSVGNEDDNNQNDSSNNNNNGNNNNNQQNINQDNLGDVNQNVTQDNDLTPEQRQMKQDNEKVLDQSMNSGSDTNVSLNQGFDNNNDQTSSTQTSSDNVKYKVIGKDDSDSNNIKYIIQDPDSKKTMVVDATKLRLEK